MPTGIEKDVFGTTANGYRVTRYRLKNSNGVVVEILDLGGIVTSIQVPDKHGKFSDITPGFDTLAEYEQNPAYFGAIVGRVANRIHNGKFELDGLEFSIVVNSPPNHIHGGLIGFDKKIWQCQVDAENRLLMSLVSEGGDEGFPGTLSVEVTYELSDDNALIITYTASVTDKPTIVNLTNHSYFNLAGHDAANIYDHEVTVNADSYLPKTEDGTPTGEIASVTGTAFDLRCSVLLSDRIGKVHGAPGVLGFDHNFCLAPSMKQQPVATVVHPTSGRALDIFTDQPGLQLYTGNHLDGLRGKHGAVYRQHSCLALETQKYPDAVHHTNFPSWILHPGDIYRHSCTYKFYVID